MKLCFITEFFPESNSRTFSGGVEAHTFYLVAALKKQGQNVQVIHRASTQVDASYSSLFARLTFIIRSFNACLKADADVIIGTNFVTYLPAFFAALIKKKPSVAWYPDVLVGRWIQSFGSLGLIGEAVERLTVRLPWSKIIALSHETKKKLVQIGVTSTKISVAHPGVDTNEIQSVKVKKNKAPTVSYIGRFVTYKRTADLIAAFAQVIKKIPQARLELVGSGPEEKKLRAQVKKRQLSESVQFSSHLSRHEVIATLKASHILCLPSVIEGFGLVTLEAAASATPFVNANTPINREVTQGGLGGLLFQPQNSEDLAQKILLLLSNKKLYHLKQKEGINLAKHYTWKKTATKTLRALSSVVR